MSYCDLSEFLLSIAVRVLVRARGCRGRASGADRDVCLEAKRSKLLISDPDLEQTIRPEQLLYHTLPGSL